MCKTTTNRQTSTAERVRNVRQPTTGGGGGGGGGGGTPPPATTIQREHVADVVYIAAGNDGGLQSAVTFHNFFGFRNARIKRYASIEDLFRQLALQSTPISRLRIVSHADNIGIFSPMVDGDVRVNIQKTEMRAFVEGDAEWLFTKIQRFHFLGTGQTALSIAEIILTHILNATTVMLNGSPVSNRLTPFNYTSTSHPRTSLANFVLCALTTQVINGNFVKSGGSNLSSAQKAIFISVYTSILDLCKRNLLTSNDYPGVTASHIDALAQAVTHFQLVADYGITPGVTDIATATVTALVKSKEALNRNFRQDFDQVRQRFSSTSWIDIRGCRAGTDRDYLVAFAEFFGRPGNLPHVSAPVWFQKFPDIGSNTFTTLDELNELLDNGLATGNGSIIMGSSVRDALDSWFTAVGYTDAYFNRWRDTINGSAANFALMTWRTAIPATFLIREGRQQGFGALSFSDAVKKVKEMFGVATGSQPTNTTLTNLQAFVTNDLPGHMQKLTRTPAVFAEVKAVSDALSANIVTGSGAGVTQSQLQAFQTQLIEYIDTNRLQHIRSLLVTARTLFADDHAKYHFYFRLGVPALVIFESDFPNNRVFAHFPTRHEALKILLREYWEETLPTPNNISGVLLNSNRQQDRPVAALANDHEDTRVVLSPTPDYYNKIEKT